MTKLVFGADPEIFASENVGGTPFVVPPVVFRTILGMEIEKFDYKHPLIKTFSDGIKIIEDGVAFEFTVPPQSSIKSLQEKILAGYDRLEEITNKFGFGVSVIPTIDFDTEKFTNNSDEFLMCLIFGCDPDYDAWEIEREAKIIDALKHPKRYGAGHIHISGSPFIKQFPVDAIKLLSITVGNFVVGHSTMPELDRERTFLYGKPGKFRIQEYPGLFNGIPDTDIGIEYRTPSNNWTINRRIPEEIQFWIEKAILEFLPNENLRTQIIHDFREPTLSGILKADTKTCLEILRSLP